MNEKYLKKIINKMKKYHYTNDRFFELDYEILMTINTKDKDALFDTFHLVELNARSIITLIKHNLVMKNERFRKLSDDEFICNHYFLELVKDEINDLIAKPTHKELIKLYINEYVNLDIHTEIATLYIQYFNQQPRFKNRRIKDILNDFKL